MATVAGVVDVGLVLMSTILCACGLAADYEFDMGTIIAGGWRL